LASKTTLTKERNQMGSCDDPKGISKGHTCDLTPNYVGELGIPTHPCFTGSVGLYCPIESNVLNRISMLQVHCQVCGGLTSRAGDTDSRTGHMEVQLTWGPNMIDGVIDESAISGYAVYAANDCGERQGDALATITALGIPEGGEVCCNNELYQANVRSKLPDGVTSQSFMVVPLTSLGALDVGWVSSRVVDAFVTTTTTTTTTTTATNATTSPPDASEANVSNVTYRPAETSCGIAFFRCSVLTLLGSFFLSFQGIRDY
jgi:hypothetical protein